MARLTDQLVTFSDLQWAISNGFTAIYGFSENDERCASKTEIEERISVETIAGDGNRLPSWDELIAVIAPPSCEPYTFYPDDSNGVDGTFTLDFTGCGDWEGINQATGILFDDAPITISIVTGSSVTVTWIPN